MLTSRKLPSTTASKAARPWPAHGQEGVRTGNNPSVVRLGVESTSRSTDSGWLSPVLHPKLASVPAP